MQSIMPKVKKKLVIGKKVQKKLTWIQKIKVFIIKLFKVKN